MSIIRGSQYGVNSCTLPDDVRSLKSEDDAVRHVIVSSETVHSNKQVYDDDGTNPHYESQKESRLSLELESGECLWFDFSGTLDSIRWEQSKTGNVIILTSAISIPDGSGCYNGDVEYSESDEDKMPTYHCDGSSRGVSTYPIWYKDKGMMTRVYGKANTKNWGYSG